ncbi:MAG: ATP-binding protein [Dehalococcoidia bacterium]
MTELPTGTLTFLFTDTEDSTPLLHRFGDRYADLLATQRALLRTAFRAQEGYEVDTQGDAFFVAFPRATQAVAAAVAAQQALEEYRWPEGAVMRVRMGLHTGEPLRTAEGYTGLDVVRGARIGASGHGGQVLISQVTADLVRQDLPSGVSLRDLGQHRFKGLLQPEHVYQLLIPDLPLDFPAIKSLDGRPNNLPSQLTPFVGRQREVAAVRALLQQDGVRLVTLTGPGGTGKTRLSLQVAAELSDEFADGVFFIDLAALNDPALVPATIAEALSLREVSGVPLLEHLKAFLRDKHVLLILDNFEQILDASQSVAEVLTACTRLKVLVTSRTVLRLVGEHDYPVPSLALPEHVPALTAEALFQFESVRLFVERARAANPSFNLSDANAAAVAEICLRLDGLPLAIELAAARSLLLAPRMLLSRLENRLNLLTGGARDLPTRQQTLRQAIAWSYDLLTEPEKMLFRRLSVFAGGWSLEAAEGVGDRGQGVGDRELGTGNWELGTGARTVPETLDVLASLVDKSLVLQREQDDGDSRFRLLETIREFSLEQLAANGEAEPARWQHATYYLALAEAAGPKLGSAEQGIWLRRLEQEHDNLRAAFNELQAQGPLEEVARLALALSRFWEVRGHWSEGRRRLELLLSNDHRRATALRARLLRAAAILAREQTDNPAADRYAEESLTIERRHGDPRGVAASLLALGIGARNQGDPSRAQTLFEEGLTLAQELGDSDLTVRSLHYLGSMATGRRDFTGAARLLGESLATARQVGDQGQIAASLQLLGLLAMNRGQTVDAGRLHEESLTMARELGDKGLIAASINNLGRLAALRRDFAAARSMYEESLAIARALGTKNGIATELGLLGDIARQQGDFASARRYFSESLTLFYEAGNRHDGALCLLGLALLAAAEGKPEQAAQVLAASAALREALHAPLPVMYQAEYDRGVVRLSASLGEEDFRAAWAKGRVLSLEQAVAYALEG